MGNLSVAKRDRLLGTETKCVAIIKKKVHGDQKRTRPRPMLLAIPTISLTRLVFICATYSGKSFFFITT